MFILAVDDEQNMLEELAAELTKVFPQANIHVETEASAAAEWVKCLKEEGIYCFYTPFIDNKGFFVSDYLLYIDETSVADLEKLRDYMISRGLKCRAEAYWEPSWGKQA